MLSVREHIPANLKSIENSIEGFYVKVTLNKKKSLLGYSYNSSYSNLKFHLSKLSENLDLYISKYDHLLLLGNFNAEF